MGHVDEMNPKEIYETPGINVRFEVFTAVIVSSRLTLFLARVIYSTLKMEATHSTETTVYNKPTRRHVPQHGRKGLTPCSFSSVGS
jgi:hypothetical protein